MKLAPGAVGRQTDKPGAAGFIAWKQKHTAKSSIILVNTDGKL